MKANDYGQWCDPAGLYQENESHTARYREYRKKLSEPGLLVAVLCDFLQDNSPAIDVQAWREFCVYEPGRQRTERIELTAKALEAIGANATAAKVRGTKGKTSKSFVP